MEAIGIEVILTSIVKLPDSHCALAGERKPYNCVGENLTGAPKSRCMCGTGQTLALGREIACTEGNKT